MLDLIRKKQIMCVIDCEWQSLYRDLKFRRVKLINGRIREQYMRVSIDLLKLLCHGTVLVLDMTVGSYGLFPVFLLPFSIWGYVRQSVILESKVSQSQNNGNPAHRIVHSSRREWQQGCIDLSKSIYRSRGKQRRAHSLPGDMSRIE